MGKKNKRKNRKKTNPPPPINNPPVNNENPKDEPPKKKWWQKGWAFVIGFIILAGGYVSYIQISDHLKSTHENFQTENIDTGHLKSPELPPSSNFGYITLETQPIFTKARIDSFPIVKGIRISEKGTEVLFIVGNGAWMVSKDTLKKGIKFVNPSTPEGCYQTSLRLVLKNNRIYASAEFRDFKKEELVGKMDFNRWEVYLKNLLTYNYDDDRLEVMDKQGYVIFSILYSDKGQSNNGAVSLSGYFLNPNSVLVVDSDTKLTLGINAPIIKVRCFSKNNGKWPKETEETIKQIRSVFPK